MIDPTVTTSGRDYTIDWNTYRRRWRWFLGTFFGGFAIMGILAFLIHDQAEGVKSLGVGIFGVVASIWYSPSGMVSSGVHAAVAVFSRPGCRITTLRNVASIADYGNGPGMIRKRKMCECLVIVPHY
jgi:hypothetical protein